MNGEASNHNQTVKLIAQGVIGLALIIAFFLILGHTNIHGFLKPHIPIVQAMIDASSFRARNAAEQKGEISRITSGIDSSILLYGQYIKKATGKFPDITPGYWMFTWRQPGEVKGFEHKEAGFSIRYDYNGNMIGFDNNAQDPVLSRVQTSGENDALFDARYFLGEYGVKNRALKVVSKETTRRGDNFSYKFVFEAKSVRYRGLIEQYSVELAGKQIISFHLKRIPDREALESFPAGNSADASVLFISVIWIAIVLASIVRFIRKLRTDELEFSRALRIGVIAGVLLLGVMVLRGLGVQSIYASLLQGVLSGGGVLLLALITLPLAESEARASWPEKLVFTDLIFQGRIMFRETGVAIMHAFFNVGVSLLLFGVAVYVMSQFNIGYFVLDGDAIETFGGASLGVMLLIANVLLAGLLGLTLFGFWPSFLRRRIANNTLLILIITVSIALGNIKTGFLIAQLDSVFLFIPIAFFWAVITYRCEWLTLLFTLAGIMIFLDLPLLFIQPENIGGVIGMGTLALTLTFFLTGAFLVFQQRSARDYESYVPEYVNRMAEKERLVRELEIARSVQMRFLPQKVPEFPSLEIVSLCQPAMEVGGDYYDFIQMDERHMSLLIGDVSGKGVSAAFFMTMVKGIIKTLSKKILRPSVLLTEANEIFCENAPRSVFVTIIYGVFDLKEKTLTIARAGHNPVIHRRRADGVITSISPRGIALGLYPGERYARFIEDITVKFEPGDIFVFYTDGVSESMNLDNDVFGEERLKEVISRSAGLSPRIIQRNIVDAVSAFSGKAPQHDDFTMIVVKIRED